MAEFFRDGDIELRAIEPEDFEILYKWENEIDAWVSGSLSAPVSKYLLWEYLQHYCADIYKTQEVRMMILQAGEPVGVIDVFNFDTLNARAEVGVFVDAIHRAQGVGERAVNIAVEKYAFGRLRLHQVYCTVRSSNQAAKQLFRSVGFGHENLLRSWIADGKGGFEDAVMMHRFAPDFGF
ncbi:MAG: GNAT family N-acetyltransferase [Muribaculaceae bacterium]